MSKAIVITGGPGCGKTTVLKRLKQRGYFYFDEVSREIIREAQKRGIEQLFLTHPIEFSNKVLSGRLNQFLDAKKMEEDFVFIDRGIHDVLAYLNYTNDDISSDYKEVAKHTKYDFVFLLPPWEDIYVNDNERYETFIEATKIFDNIKKTYEEYGYEVIVVPTGPIEERVNYILNVVLYS